MSFTVSGIVPHSADNKATVDAEGLVHIPTPLSQIEAWLGHPVELGPDELPIFKTTHDKMLVELMLRIKKEMLDKPEQSYREKRAVAARILREANGLPIRSVVDSVDAALGRDEDRIRRSIENTQHVERGLSLKKELIDWLKGPLMLQRPDGSQFHKLREASNAATILVPVLFDADKSFKFDGPDDIEAHQKLLAHEHQSFVIEHDWASAFKGAKDFDGGEVRLPFDICAFEFRINGKHVIVSVGEGDERSGTVFVKLADEWALLWFFLGDDNWNFSPSQRSRWVQGALTNNDSILHYIQPLADLLAENIRAVAISLDAEVTHAETIRAPHKLNRAREKRGKLPLLDYHVVALSRRERAARLPADPNAEPGTPRRLHFRRGHWRHYDNHKTWIKWMLVGNPDLGFVDKHYKL